MAHNEFGHEPSFLALLIRLNSFLFQFQHAKLKRETKHSGGKDQSQTNLIVVQRERDRGAPGESDAQRQNQKLPRLFATKTQRNLGTFLKGYRLVAWAQRSSQCPHPHGRKVHPCPAPAGSLHGPGFSRPWGPVHVSFPRATAPSGPAETAGATAALRPPNRSGG